MSIDSCYEKVIAKLTEQGRIVSISKKLLSCTKNDERVLYVYQLLEELKAFPKIINVSKNNAVSTHYRNLGNNHFQKQRSVLQRTENHKAWQYYNLSLLHAQLNSDNYCLALANRSAAFFEIKEYEACLNDLQKVFSMKYPEKLKVKLGNRKNACEDVLSKKTKSPPSLPELDSILKLKEAKDSRYQCSSTKLEVVFNDKMGRHVIAKEDIKVGEALIEEDPYLSLLLTSQFLVTCNHCLSRDLNLMPCENCCYTLYCSEECKNKAYEEYHKYECSLLPTLIHMEFTKLELLSLRTSLRARSDHPEWSNIFDTIEKAEANKDNEFRGHIKVDGNWVYDSKYYASIHMLASNIEKRSISDIFQKAVTAAVFLKFLEGTEFLKNAKVDEDKVRRTVASMLLLHLMTSPTNMHSITTNTQDGNGNYVQEMSIASAPYAFHSLLNHSCSPNIVRFSKLGSGKMTTFALRPIKKGSQLYDNYGSHHAVEDRASRQQNVKFQYKFTCLCEACYNNWPTYFKLKPANNLPGKLREEIRDLLNPTAIEKLQKGDKAKAAELYRPLCDLAEQLEPFIPCKELADVQESIKQCHAIFEGLVPYGFSNLVEFSAIPPKLN